MIEVVFTKGLPGSGKSTWARQQEGYYVVNRDAIRHMLGRYDDFSTVRESIVAEACRAAVETCVYAGRSVIIDETHTTDRPVRETINHLSNWHPFYRVQDFTDVPFNVCIERVLERELAGGIHIPIEVMERMQRNLINRPWTLDKIVKGYV